MLLAAAALLAGLLAGGAAAQAGGGSITELDQLSGQKVGVVTGAVFDQALLDRVPDALPQYYNSQSDAVAALLSGRIAAIVTDEPMARDIAARTPGLALVKEMFRADSYAFALPLGSEALCGQINEVLARFREDGTLAQVDAVWFGADEDAKVLPDLELTGENGVLRFATCSSHAPFSFIKDGQVVGYDIDLILRICGELGYSLELFDMDFGGIIPGITAGKYDVAGACITVTEERRQSVLFSDPDYTGGIVALVPDGSAATGGSWLDSLRDSFVSTFVTEGRWKLFAQGLGVTLVISVCAAVLGTLLGFGVCMARRSRRRWLRVPAALFVRLIQGVPVLVILMILCYLVMRSASGVAVAVAGFTINFAAYVSEMMRTGIDGVDPGQLEAAAALGFSPVQTFLKITFPQAARRVLPVYRGEFISMVKMTSVAGYIAVQDLTRMSDIVRGLTYNAFFSLIATAVIYFVLAYLLVSLLTLLERRIDPKRRKRELKGVTLP